MNPKLWLTAVLPLSLSFPLSLLTPQAQASVALLQEMSLHSMLESTVTVLTTLGDYTTLNPDQLSDGTAAIGGAGISWSGSYSESGWRYDGTGNFGGMPLSMHYTATLTGTYGVGDISVAVAGVGMLGSQALRMTGSSDWIFNAARDEYFDMNFAQETKIGANSNYGWVVGYEKVLCFRGTSDDRPPNSAFSGIAGAEPGALTAIASAGKKVRYGGGAKNCYAPIYASNDPVVLVGEASSGKKGSITVSQFVKSPLSNTQHAAPTQVLAVTDYLSAENQATLVGSDGGLDADDMDNRYRSSGQFANGSFSGVTTDVPEPGTAWLVGWAMALLVVVSCRRRLARHRQAA